jgi:hypothetical protein
MSALCMSRRQAPSACFPRCVRHMAGMGELHTYEHPPLSSTDFRRDLGCTKPKVGPICASTGSRHLVMAGGTILAFGFCPPARSRANVARRSESPTEWIRARQPDML